MVSNREGLEGEMSEIEAESLFKKKDQIIYSSITKYGFINEIFPHKQCG